MRRIQILYKLRRWLEFHEPTILRATNTFTQDTLSSCSLTRLYRSSLLTSAPHLSLAHSLWRIPNRSILSIILDKPSSLDILILPIASTNRQTSRSILKPNIPGQPHPTKHIPVPLPALPILIERTNRRQFRCSKLAFLVRFIVVTCVLRIECFWNHGDIAGFVPCYSGLSGSASPLSCDFDRV